MSHRSTTTTLSEAIEMAKAGTKAVIRCPAHDDESPSLGVSPGSGKQPVTLHCYANCDIQDILAAEGLTFDDISRPREEMEQDSQKVWTPAGETTANLVYPYYDADGGLLYEVIRINHEGDKKSIRQRRPDKLNAGKHIWNLEGVEKTIFRLPRVLEAVKAGGTIHVAEGEKCVLALEGVIPATDAATCNSGGAGKWADRFSEYLAGATVILYADADDPGRAHVRNVRESLEAHGCTVRTMEVPPGRLPSGKAITDIADHLEAGRNASTLLETGASQMAEKARTGIDVLDMVKRPRAETEWVIEGLLAKQDRLIIVGPEGQGKSQLLRQFAACTAAGLNPITKTAMEPRRVLYIDAENTPDQTHDSWSHLVGLSSMWSHPIERGMLTILEEWDSEIDLTSPDGAAWLEERANAYQPDLIIMGPLTNLVRDDMGKYEPVDRLRKATNRVRAKSGAALIMEHHSPLAQGSNGKRETRPYGSGLFLKWPEFGYSIVPTEERGLYEFRPFRGDRVRGRGWPDAIRWGSQEIGSQEFPWEESHLPEGYTG